MTISHFDRSALPPPQSFYERELGEFRRPCRGWAAPKSGCPFHQSESKTSFRVNLDSGGFNCFGCGAKGGDVLAFVRLRYNLSFEQAARQLGAWGGQASQSPEMRQLQAERERQRQEEASRVQQQRIERIASRNALHELEREYAAISARLGKVQDQLKELAWWYLSDLHTRIREAEQRYYKLAGLEASA